MSVTKISTKTLFQRALEGRVLYTHVVVAETQSLIFISGQLARDKSGNIGPRDMRTQIRQVGENIRAALEAAGITLAHLVKTTTFVTDIDEFFQARRHPPRLFGRGSSGQHDRRGATPVAP